MKIILLSLKKSYKDDIHHYKMKVVEKRWFRKEEINTYISSTKRKAVRHVVVGGIGGSVVIKEHYTQWSNQNDDGSLGEIKTDKSVSLSFLLQNFERKQKTNNINSETIEALKEVNSLAGYRDPALKD